MRVFLIFCLLFAVKRDVAAYLADGVGMDIEERGNVLQVEHIYDAGATTEQLVVTFMGCGTMEVLIACLELVEHMLAYDGSRGGAFKTGAHLNDFVVLAGRVTYVGNSSVEVRVDTYVENLQGERKRINTAYVVMIAIDKNTERPVRVPRYVPQDMRGRIEWENAEKRQQQQYFLRHALPALFRTELVPAVNGDC